MKDEKLPLHIFAFIYLALMICPVPSLEAKIISAETSQYRILYYPTGISLPPSSKSLTQDTWYEIIYKLNVLTDEKDRFFGSEGWIEVSLTDKDGFALASDIVQQKDLLLGADYYGYLWVRNKNNLAGAKVRALTMPQLITAKKNKIRERKLLRQLFQDQSYDFDKMKAPVLAGAFVHESFEGSETDSNLLKVEQNIERLNEDQPVLQKQELLEASEANSAEPAVDMNPYKDAPERITNQDVEKALKGLDLEVERRDKNSKEIGE